MNWDQKYYSDILRGRGFTITEPGQVNIDGIKHKTMGGPQSPLYGTTYGDEEEFMERFRCQCGTFKGKAFKGHVCPFCHKPVELKDIDIHMTGWINFRAKKFIHPHYYQKLTRLIGKYVFPDIIDIKQRVDSDGNVVPLEDGDIKEPLSQFSGIGIEEFMVRFDEILSYFQSKKKNKFQEFEDLKKLKTSIFASSVPIYTIVLRPQSNTSDTVYYTGIDKEVNTLFRLSESLADCEPIEVPIILTKIQKRVNAMWDYNFQLITSKDGWIRDKLFGGDLNFSARNVITIDPSLRDDEIDMSYQTFRIIFQYHIIECLVTMSHMPLDKAYDRWKRSYIFDSYIYETMLFLIKKHHTQVLINRNPTLITIWCR